MATPADNVLMVVNFQMDLGTTPTEIAEIGFWGTADDPTPADSAAWDTFLEDLATFAVDQWAPNMTAGNFSPELSLVNVKAIHYDASGHTANEKVAAPTDAWAGTGGAALPWQIAQVVGLYSYTPGTFIAHAGQRRGRVYLPGLSVSMMATSGPTAGEGLFDQSKAEANRDGVGAFLDAVRSHTNTSPPIFTPSVYSRVGSHFWPITDLTTDVKPDTQRRRVNKLKVSRLAVTAPWV